VFQYLFILQVSEEEAMVQRVRERVNEHRQNMEELARQLNITPPHVQAVCLITVNLIRFLG
jgi:hypothetical protein